MTAVAGRIKKKPEKTPQAVSESEAWYPSIVAVEPGKQQDQYDEVGGCCCKIKTEWENGSTTKTTMRYKNGLKTSLFFYFYFENAKKIGSVGQR